MTAPGRRAFLAALAAAATLPALGGRSPAAEHLRSPAAEHVLDGAERPVAVPARVGRVLPAGPPAAILLYALAPDLLIGWPRANGPAERAFLDPEIGARPEIGRLAGRGSAANLEAVLRLEPDLILDVGSTERTYVSFADRVQKQTGIPYALLDGRLGSTARSLRSLGRLIGREERAAELAGFAEDVLRAVRERVAAVPEERRPRTYYARGPEGLETGLAGSINVEVFEALGARNVAGGQRGGLAAVSLEQVLAWDPEVIVAIHPRFARSVRSDPDWTSVSALRSGRVHLSPHLPFGWIDFPPSVNRLIGLPWLGKVLYPDFFQEDLRPAARDFYARFYHVDLTEGRLDRVMASRR